MAPERSIWTPCFGCSCPNHDISSTYDLHHRASSHYDHIDVTHLATTNDYPVPGEISALQAIIHDAEEHLGYLYRKISDVTRLRRDLEMQTTCLDRRLKELGQACHDTKHDMKEKQKLLSPIRRLPAEIFHEIFLATIDFPPQKYWCAESEQWKLSVSAISSPAVWSIERVSKGWRAAVHACPKAWSFFTVTDTRDFQSEGYNNVVRMSRHLARSGQLPLSIAIHRPRGSSWNCPTKLLSSLIPFANRFKFLYLFVPTRTLEGFQALEYTCDALQTLVVVANDSVPPPDDGPPPVTVPIDIFLKAPQLRKVELWDVFDAFDRIPLPTKQITEFTNVYRRHCGWNHNHVESILDILETATDLQHFTGSCDGVAYPETLELPSPIVKCPQLRSLRISIGPDVTEGFPYLLQHIAAPNLTHLDLGSTRAAESLTIIIIPAVFDLLKHSRCSSMLASLKLSDMSIQKDDVGEILRSLPALEELCLKNVGKRAVTDYTLHELTFTVRRVTGKPSCALPKLHTLHLDGPWEFNEKNFVEMVKSRWIVGSDGPVRLRSVLLAWRGEIPVSQADEVRRMLGSYREDGLDFQYITP
ncbi:hypothetical protein EV421DRAFT_638956 [Armillaria borealis]|uniref:F-box domain-containing protein n=1 Tax=Armillaria borealis TaxID=47425 RepID=A0AA39MNX9_9AGAR|nr:hypothetical protein EV421DRAFT_638956 [Armillaria borealis]